ncbi:MAG: hypothetical protein ABI318_01125 [Chthoniobacteraceae bacterium]
MFPTLVLQVVLAVVVAKLTLAGSRSQKWWERKAELYASLIEKLYDIHSYNSQYNDDIYTDPDTLSEDQKASHETKWKALVELNKRAEAEVEKLTHVGTFLISKEVHGDLLAFKKESREAEQDFRYGEHKGNPCTAVERICDAVTKCIESVREHSKDDLGLNSRLGRFIQKVRSFSFE